jgi:hypothetical protein
MALNTSTLVNAIASHASALGCFDAVNGHEPKNAPGGQLTCAIWGMGLAPVLSSGLSATSVKVVFSVRLYMPALNYSPEQADMIDPAMMDAADLLLADYVGNFTLGGLIREVDVRGAEGGNSLSWDSGYINQDNHIYRVITIYLPLVINDLWTEAP